MESGDDGGPQKTEVATQEKEVGSRPRKIAGSTVRPLTKITPKHRRFADFLLVHEYDYVQAYMDAYQCSRATAQKLARRLMLDPLFMKFRDSIQMPMLESVEADRAWLAQHIFHLANSNMMDYWEYEDGSDLPTLRRLDRLALWKQQNIKKLKTTTRITGKKKNRVISTTVELELYDRAAHVHKVALALGVYGDGETTNNDMADRLIEAEGRRLAYAYAERQRRIENGEMKEDGVLIEHDGDPTVQ